MTTFKLPAVILDELGISEAAEIDIEAIAQYCGATVIYDRLDGCEARILGVGDRAIITVSATSPRGRQRFSAAHELGHWMRDRGKVAFACTDRVLFGEWGQDNPERRANRYAVDLLLPPRIFERQARTMPVSLATARSLATKFQTSVTSTAIRLVEAGGRPSMIVFSEASGRKWFVRSPIVPPGLWPTNAPGSGSVAAKLLSGGPQGDGPETVDADEWIEHPDASRYTLLEDSVIVRPGSVLTLLWWKDEQQIIDLAERDEDDQREGGEGRDRGWRWHG